ncbi:trna pseudouridine synthase b [Lasius niger]|uniref:tRNA pseudouridine(55) synthase n=1 Tax=Lasius niger TaxID=67767 RepID=A0A0J7KVA2_LASNI|nr:trna pseudouridine synthase b [Lasius niger]
MGRVKTGLFLDGWVLLDKPVGVSSAFAVNKVRHFLNARKAGHAGTLDPLASGALPIAFGKATSTIPYVMDGEKMYRFLLIFGESRDTGDGEGVATATSDVIPSKEDVEAVFPQFLGDILQHPPIYSALKVNGRRACDLVREGKSVSLAPRKVRINHLKIISADESGQMMIEVSCGKGVYVRSLAYDIAQACGAEGYVGSLRRMRCGPFSLAEDLPPETLSEAFLRLRLDKTDKNPENKSDPSLYLLPIATALDDIPALCVTAEDGERLSWGQKVSAPSGLEAGIYQIRWDDHLIGLGQLSEGELRAARMFENHQFWRKDDVEKY